MRRLLITVLGFPATEWLLGTPEWFMDFAAQYPARAFPCQRFTGTVARTDA